MAIAFGYDSVTKARKIKTATVRIEEDLVKMANVVSSLRDLSAPDYLSGVLRPILERDYQEALEKAAKEMKKGNRPDGSGKV